VSCKIWGFRCGDYEECLLLGCYTVWLSWFLQEPHGITSQKMAFFTLHSDQIVSLADWLQLQNLTLHKPGLISGTTVILYWRICNSLVAVHTLPTETILRWRMASSVMLCHVGLVRTDISEELSASIIRVTRFGELGTLAVTSNRCTQRNCGEAYTDWNIRQWEVTVFCTDLNNNQVPNT
jgi:hypothetical protein